MEYVKAHLLATILATQVSALIWGKVPYFPIEISRTAASGPIPLTIFRIGIVSVIATLFITKSLNIQTFVVWISLSTICLFDDVNYWALHMSGVAGLLLVSIYSIYLRGRACLAPCIMAIVIYGLRNLMKITLIALMEIDKEKSFKFMSKEWMQDQFTRHMAIMYNGEKACLNPNYLMPAFKISAVLQWVLLYSISFCF